MKIITVGANQIRLVISQWILHLLGLVILICSLFSISFLMLEYTIVCKEKQLNSARSCTLESNIFNVYHSTTGLGQLKGAFVMSGRSSKGGTVYSVNLVTDKGTVNLTGGSSSGRTNKDSAAQAINNYVSQSLDTHFKIPYPTPWWVYVLATFISLLGIVLLAVRGVSVDFDRILKTIIIRRKGIFQTDEKKLSFSDVEQVIIQESRGSKGSMTYRLALAIKDQPALPFVSTYDTSLTKKERVAKQLNDFMQIHDESKTIL
ncbi:hypothetical protein [Legionella quateirensis]|uniref:Transmembrane protein n=1 Tax=Legionella quateirensis TaxID=45072 RepID=A0A378KNU0_9GAMM|nr:hypothetical protein [Legionella quateirensis]KTD44813.1 hypothetical protein Lqua_2648 [Legionella quateirensis]STY16272.1 Uncharacterised protein [Legionella quateirensis]